MTYIVFGVLIAFFAAIGLFVHKRKLTRSRIPCERCGEVGGAMPFHASSTPTTRDYCRVFKDFYYEKPIDLCFQCFLAQDFFLGKVLMLSIGHQKEIKEAEKVWGNQAVEMLALLWTARESMDDARRILTEEAFEKARPWLEERLAEK